jgi:chemotaxis protein MotA
MIIIVGLIVVVLSVLGGFTMAGGHIGALFHPSELVTIGGSALGALIMMSPGKVLKDLMSGVIQALKGSQYNKKTYEELFKALFELFTIARRDGLLALDSHINTPHESTVFSKYPTLHSNHHNLDFLCGAFGLIIDGSLDPKKIHHFLDTELKALKEDHHGPIGVLMKTADGLPGFGIVAAVLGIVITMGAISGPVDEIGHKVGAALVGTFLGILLSYGVFAPLAVKMEFLGELEMGYFRTIATIIEGFTDNLPPKSALELGRRGLNGEVKITVEELNGIFAEVSGKG